MRQDRGPRRPVTFGSTLRPGTRTSWKDSSLVTEARSEN
ncbi:hypothetical protein STIAU_2143, partial [Stigmatella aurantiaca DW4/3-1]